MRITKKTSIFMLFNISILMLFSACTKHEKDNPPTVFKDVNVITMCNDSILHQHSVWVEEGKIIDIGVFEDMEIPEGTQIIDGKEHYLIPGLGDMHVHISDVDEGILFIANGVTLVRNMCGFPFHLELRDEINEKQLPGPEIYTTGRIIDGKNPYWPDASIVVDDKEKVFEIVSQMKKEGYDAIKVYEKLTKEVYYEILRVAKELDMLVMGHVPEALNIKDVLSSGQYSIEHLDGYEKKHFLDTQVVSETMKSGIWNCPTLIVHKNYENLNDLKENPPDVIKYVHPKKVEYWNTFHQTNLSLDKNKLWLDTLTKSNAKIVAGTDVGPVYVVAGFSLHEELCLRQDAGLTPYQILLSATRNCAAILGYEHRLGTIEKGKDADLILLKKNPLEDIGNTQSIAGVMTKGSWYTEEELHSMLDEVASRKHPTKQKACIHNSLIMKLLLGTLMLIFISTFLVRPVLFIFSRKTFMSLTKSNISIKKYRIRFLLIALSSICSIILILLVSLSESDFQYGLPYSSIGFPLILKFEILLPIVNIVLLIPLLILYFIAFRKKHMSAFRKWHTLAIIVASIILSVLLNYWGFLKLYL